MVLEIDRESILREPDRDCVLRKLVKYAEQLALLGEVDAARQLINLRNHARIRKPDEKGLGPLDWVWRETGQWPEGVAENLKTDERFTEMRKEYESDDWAKIPEKKRKFDEIGLEECLRADREQERFADATSGHDAMLKGQRLVKALDISVRLMRGDDNESSSVGETNAEQLKDEKDTTSSTDENVINDDWINVARLDQRSTGIAKQIVSRWNANCQIKYLMEAEKLWPLYITGVLARAMGLSRAEMEEKKTNVISTFSERLAHAHLPPLHAGKPIRELLDISQRNTWPYYRDELAEMTNADKSEEWTMWKEAASEEEISNLEERLSITLPADYKEFLRITNGFSTKNLWGIFTGIVTDPAIWDVSRVKWTRDRQQPAELLELPREIEEMGDFRSRPSEDGLDWDTACPLLDDVVQIGHDDDLEVLFLIPPKTVEQVRAAYEIILSRADEQSKAVVLDAIDRFAGSKDAFDRLEWCCCTIGDYAEMRSYSSFRNYLEHAASEGIEQWKETP